MTNYPVQWLGNKELDIVQCGHEACEPGHEYGPAVRNHFLIHFIISGCGTFRNSLGEYKLEEGDLFFIAPGELTLYRADVKRPWTYVWLGFVGSKSEELTAEAGLSTACPTAHCPSCAGIFRDMVTEIDLLPARFSGRAMALRAGGELLRALAQLTSRLPEPPEPPGFSEDVAAFIRSNISSSMSVTQLAADFGYTRTYFSTRFKKEAGQTPVQFLMDCRISAARRLLIETNLNIAHVARSVGYTDALLFSRQFKARTGLSPTTLRRRHRHISVMSGGDG